MSASAVLKHSWGMVWRNKMDAARISVVLLLAILVIGFGFSAFFARHAASFDPPNMFSLWAFMLLQHVLSTLVGAWMAVAWHRYVLLNQVPKGWLPLLHGPEVLRYGMWILLMAIIYMIFSLPVMLAFIPLIAGIEAGGAPNLGLITLWVVGVLVVTTFALIVMMRLTPVLVSRSLGERLGVKQAWVATRGSSKMIFMLFFLLILIVFAALAVFGIFIGIMSAIGLTMVMVVVAVPAYLFAVWLLVLLQISIMTTIYGVYVEGRELPYSGGKLA